MEKDPWNIKANNSEEYKRVKKMRILMSMFIALAGVILLGFQLYPLTVSYIKNKITTTRTENLASPLPGYVRTEIDGEFAYWDPTTSYFENLFKNASSIADGASSYDPVTHTYKPIVIDQTYTKDMSLSIDALGIKNIRVKSNVESYSEDIYNTVLKGGLAHFKGTPVCGDGGNCFIYGHSAVQTYFQRHQNDPETIFTKLEDIEIGDIVEITRDGTIMKYKVKKIKVVDPTDFSVLEPVGTKETTTLMTCTPIGIGTHRLIVIAERYE